MELRRDPVVNRWVIIDPRRHDELQVEPGIEPAGGPCPFCSGNEGMTGREIYRVGEAGNWRVRVVADRRPLLRVEGDLNRRAEGMYDQMDAVGAHELVIETARHDALWTDLDETQLTRILFTYRARLRDLRGDARFRHLMILKNHGRAATRFAHPHSHIIALPVVPKVVDDELQGARAYYRYKERCVFCDIIREESKGTWRQVVSTSGFLATTPYASRFSFETWVLPRRHSADFDALRDEEVLDLGGVLRRTLAALVGVFPDLSCSLTLHTGPLRNGEAEAYHWHIEILPRLYKVAGFEWGTGFFVNPVPPEDAARALRAVGAGKESKG
jgi:UDPglucose--hexose-1-phosphate uridylyltransferase